jgi:hypothetical protein
METDQDYDNSQLAASAWLGEVNVASQGRWSLLPSIVVHADLLKVGESPVDEEYRSRVRLLGSLKRTLTGRLSLHLDGRGFWEFNVSEAWEQADQDQAHYAAAALSYYLEEPTWLVSGLYLRISDGRIPPVAADQTFVGVGIILE